MTIVRYTSTHGRPIGALRKHGFTRTWCAWWTGEPGCDPFVPPDAHGGARTRDEVPEIVRQHAAHFVADIELKYVTAGWAASWRRVQRGLPIGAERRAAEAVQRPQQPTLTYEEAMRLAQETNRKFAEHCERVMREEAARRQGESKLHAFAGIFAAPHFAALGLEPSATEADINQAFRKLAFSAHPDRGGTTEAFVALQRDRDAALRHARGESSLFVRGNPAGRSAAQST